LRQIKAIEEKIGDDIPKMERQESLPIWPKQERRSSKAAPHFLLYIGYQIKAAIRTSSPELYFDPLQPVTRFL
jgi:hypothetical protein